MKNPFLRLVALLLVPCLAVDPTTVSAMEPVGAGHRACPKSHSIAGGDSAPPLRFQDPFTQQALAASIEFARHILAPTPESYPVRSGLRPRLNHPLFTGVAVSVSLGTLMAQGPEVALQIVTHGLVYQILAILSPWFVMASLVWLILGINTRFDHATLGVSGSAVVTGWTLILINTDPAMKLAGLVLAVAMSPVLLASAGRVLLKTRPLVLPIFSLIGAVVVFFLSVNASQALVLWARFALVDCTMVYLIHYRLQRRGVTAAPETPVTIQWRRIPMASEMKIPLADIPDEGLAFSLGGPEEPSSIRLHFKWTTHAAAPAERRWMITDAQGRPVYLSDQGKVCHIQWEEGQPPRYTKNFVRQGHYAMIMLVRPLLGQPYLYFFDGQEFMPSAHGFYVQRPVHTDSGDTPDHETSTLAAMPTPDTQDTLMNLLNDLEQARQKSLGREKILSCVWELYLFLRVTIPEIEDKHPFMTKLIDGLEAALLSLDMTDFDSKEALAEAMIGFLKEPGISGKSYWQESYELFDKAHPSLLKGEALAAFMNNPRRKLKNLRLWSDRRRNSSLDAIVLAAHNYIAKAAAAGVAAATFNLRRTPERDEFGRLLQAGRDHAKEAHGEWNVEKALPTGGYLATMPPSDGHELDPRGSDNVAPGFQSVMDILRHLRSDQDVLQSAAWLLAHKELGKLPWGVRLTPRGFHFYTSLKDKRNPEMIGIGIEHSTLGHIQDYVFTFSRIAGFLRIERFHKKDFKILDLSSFNDWLNSLTYLFSDITRSWSKSSVGATTHLLVPWQLYSTLSGHVAVPFPFNLDAIRQSFERQFPELASSVTLEIPMLIGNDRNTIQKILTENVLPGKQVSEAA